LSQATVLMCAAAYNTSPSVIKALLNGGANVNLQDPRGKTALMYSVENKNPKITELLIANGADVHIKDFNGRPFKAH
jgi:ankyrin repeat protein